MNEWHFVDDGTPQNVELETKIDDENGVRNEQTLKRRGNLWWFPDDSMHCYYRPTHWRPVPETEVKP
jgi:hypothetical protein